jgi:hypothetical protein
MSQHRVPLSSNAVIKALCCDGPLLDSFGIDLPVVRSTPAGSTALAFLSEIAGTSDDASCLSRELMALVEIVQEDLAELDLDRLAQWLGGLDAAPQRTDAAERFWDVFAPHLAGLLVSWDKQIVHVREHRLVTIEPIEHSRSDGHILFTSNVLLTSQDAGDEHRWHFDHPMTIGADVASNEIVHGLKGLNTAIAFEKDRGTLDKSTVVDCVLSVSVTHESLIPLARDEVRRSVAVAGDLENLAVFAFTEADAERIVTEVLAPTIGCRPTLLTVFGVNGNYGRHYSFGKAIAALWQAVVDPDIDRTFKFDLDQVFPQERLVAEIGRSAFELLTTGSPWGASGVNSDGLRVNLGMCAGALVDQSDIGRGLFTPDTERPTSPPSLPDLIFRKAVPQALSTEAEMMDRGDDPPDAVRQRVHVTGGTTGITVDALIRYRPFTPSFIARAEDQAYLLSVLDGPQPRLRTAHIPGLFMRHDKESVASGAAISSEVDTAVGDYVRTILFTGYARALGSVDTSWLAPFTGSYISNAPMAATSIRLMLDVIDRSQHGDETAASELLSLGMRRIAAAYGLALAPGNTLGHQIEQERLGWDRYYAAVEALGLRHVLSELTRSIIETTRLA